MCDNPLNNCNYELLPCFFFIFLSGLPNKNYCKIAFHNFTLRLFITIITKTSVVIAVPCVFLSFNNFAIPFFTELVNLMRHTCIDRLHSYSNCETGMWDFEIEAQIDFNAHYHNMSLQCNKSACNSSQLAQVNRV